MAPLPDTDPLILAFNLLLDSEDLFHPPILTFLDTLFLRFDPLETGVLGPEQLDAFAVLVNGSAFSDEDLKGIKESFEWEGGLTRRGFGEMMYTQSMAEPEETLRDLRKCGMDI